MPVQPGGSPTAIATQGPPATDPNPLASIQDFFSVDKPWVYLISGAIVLILLARYL